MITLQPPRPFPERSYGYKTKLPVTLTDGRTVMTTLVQHVIHPEEDTTCYFTQADRKRLGLMWRYERREVEGGGYVERFGPPFDTYLACGQTFDLLRDAVAQVIAVRAAA